MAAEAAALKVGVHAHAPTGRYRQELLAARLAGRATNGARIAGDALKGFVVARADRVTVDLGLTYVWAAMLTHVCLDAGYELVVVDFVFEHPRHISRYIEALDSPLPVLALTLWARLHSIAGPSAGALRAGSRQTSDNRLRIPPALIRHDRLHCRLLLVG